MVEEAAPPPARHLPTIHPLKNQHTWFRSPLPAPAVPLPRRQPRARPRPPGRPARAAHAARAAERRGRPGPGRVRAALAAGAAGPSAGGQPLLSGARVQAQVRGQRGCGAKSGRKDGRGGVTRRAGGLGPAHEHGPTGAVAPEYKHRWGWRGRAHGGKSYASGRTSLVTGWAMHALWGVNHWGGAAQWLLPRGTCGGACCTHK